MKKAYVIGAGVTGLSTAYFLAKSGDYQATVFEKRKEIGGMAGSIVRDGCQLDLGPHKLFSNMKDRERELLDIIGRKNLLKIKKQSQIRLLGSFIDFPVGPVDVFKINPLAGLKMGLSYGAAIGRRMFSKKEDKTYEDYLKGRFGGVAYEMTFAPYARKIWGEPGGLDKELAATRVAAPSLFEMAKQMIFKVRTKKSVEISADYFYYPKMGLSVLTDRLKEEVVSDGGKVIVDSALNKVGLNGKRVVSIVVGDKEIKLEKGDVLVSTGPIEELCLMNSYLKRKLGGVVSKLKYRNLVLVYVVINKDKVSNQNWFFFPEKKYIFNRVFKQKSFSRFVIPKRKTVLCCEVTGGVDDIWDQKNDEMTINKVVSQLVECGIIKEKEVAGAFTVRMERAYPIYEIGFRKLLEEIFLKLDSFDNFYSIGRQGGFNYVGMIDCFDIGARVAANIVAGGGDRKNLRDSFFNYIVID